MLNKLFLIVLILSFNLGFSQSECYNSDFSTGTFSGWEGYHGTADNPNAIKEFKDNQHKIITTSTLEPRTCFQVPTIPPGESFSVKLGNEINGSEGETLVYSMNVTPENSIFLYKYAIIVQDPGHKPSDQPGFSVRITDINGVTIDPLCGDYQVYAGQRDQNFSFCTYIDPETGARQNVNWTPWKTVGVNLSPYIGKIIKIEFTTKDCLPGEHFGYAYISAKCAKLKADLKVCASEAAFNLTAPYGFNKYLWTYEGQPVGLGEQTISLPLADYPEGAIFECTMTAFSNTNLCESKIQIALTKPTKVTPVFNAKTSCNSSQASFNPVIFENLTSTTEPNVKWNWDFGDGTTSIDKDPTHIFVNSGNYNVKLTATTENGCTFNLITPISINNNPLAEPVLLQNQKFCSQNSTIAAINVGNQNLKWFSSLTSTVELPITTTLVDKTTYYASLSENGCLGKRLAFVASITNIPTPTGSATQYFCTIDKPTIADIDAKGTGIKWYKTINDVNVLSTATVLTNGLYYGAQTDLQSGCESKDRLKVNVILQDPPNTLPVSFKKELCLNDELVIRALKDEKTEMVIYESENAINPLSDNSPVSSGTTYYASIIDPETNCESIKRSAILASVIPCELVVYNSITIDGNDLNDHFVIKNIEFFPENTVEIYNRFGQLVYKTAKYGINENYFYGEANAGEVFQKSKKLPTGSYFYIINFKKTVSSENNLQKGFLYISNNE
ncbi:gliding motility-associated C-terminal domain-containing protein [Flavobacterium aquidurense]|uniref:T9SS type B sorting domain-containing protein n=1 Tax=Flavobacterium aquidurense TaxID=362413 RepID=UPI0028546EE7|nr:gliding motility-associated C-terminal domain-containing protein [Flavobacterium aquidurense]MDR7371486.1 PKD repeat protein [Flavobacterium aquidurense]